MTNGNPDPTNPNRFRASPIRHRSLSPELLEHIRAVYDIIGRYVATSPEEFEIGFMREPMPGVEIALWCCITAAWNNYHEQYLGDERLSDEEEKMRHRALIAISAGVEDVEQLEVSADVGRNLMASYNGLGK